MRHISMLRRHASTLALGIAAVLATGQLHAAAFQIKENSAKGLGRAFAGSTSSANDASVVATNPASMRLLQGQQFQADVSVIRFSAKLQGGYDGRYPATNAAINGGRGGDAGMIAPVPTAYFHTPLNEEENLHLGFSLMVPFGFTTEYDRDWVGRYHGVKTDMRAIDLGAAFSWDINPQFSLGASLFVERLDIEISNAVDFGAIYRAVKTVFRLLKAMILLLVMYWAVRSVSTKIPILP